MIGFAMFAVALATATGIGVYFAERVDRPSHAIGELSQQPALDRLMRGIIPQVARFVGVFVEVVELAGAEAVDGDQLVAIGAEHRRLCGRVAVPRHRVVIFRINVSARRRRAADVAEQWP